MLDSDKLHSEAPSDTGARKFANGGSQSEISKTGLVHTNMWLVVVLALVIACALQLPTPLNHDAAWHLITAFKWLSGAEVGYDVFDINPPMTMWISSFPAKFVNMTGASATIVFKVFVLLVLTCTFMLSDRLAKHYNWQAIQRTWWRVFLALGLFIAPSYDFGQREHLAAAMIVPFVLLCGLRAKKKPVSFTYAVVSGLFAGIAFGIKPYFFAVGAGLEFALLFYLRSPRQFIRPEFLVIVFVVSAYLASILIFTPGYYTQVIPAALSNYGGYDSPWILIGKRLHTELIFPFSATVMLLIVCGKNIRKQTEIIMQLAAAAGFLIAVLMQKKAWPYQVFPVEFYLFLTLGFLVGSLTNAPKFSRVAPIAGLLIGAVLVMKPLIPYVQESTSPNSTKAKIYRLAKIFEENAGVDRSVFAFITSPRDVHPAVLLSRTEWADSSGVMVYLPAYLGPSYNKQNANKALQIRMFAEKHDRSIIANLIRKKPGVIVSQFGDNRLGLEGVSISYPEYFSRYPVFADFWKQYRISETVGSYRIYIKQ